MDRVLKATGRHSWRKNLLAFLFICAVFFTGLFRIRTGAASSGIAAEKDSRQPEAFQSGGQDLEEESFDVTFIDVGQGDSTLITCGGHSMLIDGGKSSQSDKIYAILKERGITYLDYIVATHPDDDHIGGLAGALNYASVGTAFSPVEEDDSRAFQNYIKYLERQNVGITVPKAGEHYSLGSASITVLGPLEISDSDNNNSIVLKVEHGKSSFLFAGDAEKQEEDDILRSNEDLNCAILKVAHHGSAASTGDEFLAAVDPAAAVISCGKGNEYGHPTAEVLEKLKERGILVFRTDLQGDIRFYESGGDLFYEVSRNPDADVFAPGSTEETTPRSTPLQETERTEDAASSDETAAARNSSDDKTPQRHELDYIVNTNTGKFHYPDCRGVKQMKEKNKQYVTCDRQDLIDQGYDPCGICHP